MDLLGFHIRIRHDVREKHPERGSVLFGVGRSNDMFLAGVCWVQKGARVKGCSDRQMAQMSTTRINTMDGTIIDKGRWVDWTSTAWTKRAPIQFSYPALHTTVSEAGPDVHPLDAVHAIWPCNAVPKPKQGNERYFGIPHVQAATSVQQAVHLYRMKMMHDLTQCICMFDHTMNKARLEYSLFDITNLITMCDEADKAIRKISSSMGIVPSGNCHQIALVIEGLKYYMNIMDIRIKMGLEYMDIVCQAVRG